MPSHNIHAPTFIREISEKNIKYHICTIDRILFDTSFCNRINVIEDK
jgi:hypothetical protein